MKLFLFTFFTLFTLSAQNFPTLFEQLGTPLYSSAYRLQSLTEVASLQDAVLAYTQEAKSSLHYGLETSNASDKRHKSTYLKKLRHLQQHYDALSLLLRKNINSAIKEDNYTFFLLLINTEDPLFFQKSHLEKRIYAYYNERKKSRRSAYLDQRIKREQHIVKRYNPDTPTYSENSHQKSQKHSKRATHRNRVVVLSTPGCPYCRKAKSFLHEHHINFKEYNIKTSSEGQRLYRKYQGNGVPVVIINDQVIHGYSQKRMLSALRH